MKRRILQIIPSLDRAGAEKQMALLVEGLPRDEFDVHVGVLTRGGPLWDDLRRAGIPVTLIGKRWRIDPQAYWRLKRLAARLRPDLIHTWLFAANAYGRTAGKASFSKDSIGAASSDTVEVASSRRVAAARFRGVVIVCS